MPHLEGLSYHPIVPELARPLAVGEYVFDKQAARLANELERVGWDVPQWDTTLRCYGSGDERHVTLSEVEGHLAGARFYLYFNRGTGREPRALFHESVSISGIGMPHHQGRPPMLLRVYGARRPPELLVYCGDNWDNHYTEFYGGWCEDTWRYVNFEGSFQQLEGGRYGAPSGVTFSDAAERAEHCLNLLADRIIPLPSRHVSMLDLATCPADELARPVTAFMVVDAASARRIARHKAGDRLLPWARYAALPTRPITSLGTSTLEGEYPRAACQNFIWMTLKQPDLGDHELYPIFRSGLNGGGRLVKATIRVANDAYVVDQAPRTAAKRKFWANHERLAPEELEACNLVMARTIMPLDLYQDHYADPLLLLTRELRMDEVELL